MFKHMLGGGLIFLNVHPYLGISNLTKIFQMGWNHQLENLLEHDSDLKVIYIRQKKVCANSAFLQKLLVWVYGTAMSRYSRKEFLL